MSLLLIESALHWCSRSGGAALAVPGMFCFPCWAFHMAQVLRANPIKNVVSVCASVLPPDSDALWGALWS